MKQGQERPIGLRDDQRLEVCRQASDRNADPALLFFARALTGIHNPIRPTRHCYNATDGHFACVDAEGEVYLGNPQIGDRRYSIGNILASSWHDIWRSPRHLEVISLMDALQQSAQCRLSACRHVRANIGAEQALSLYQACSAARLIPVGRKSAARPAPVAGEKIAGPDAGAGPGGLFAVACDPDRLPDATESSNSKPTLPPTFICARFGIPAPSLHLRRSLELRSRKELLLFPGRVTVRRHMLTVIPEKPHATSSLRKAPSTSEERPMTDR